MVQMYICNPEFSRNYQRIWLIIGKMFSVLSSCKTEKEYDLKEKIQVKRSIFLNLFYRCFYLHLFLLYNSWFWRNSDHYLHRKNHTCMWVCGGSWTRNEFFWIHKKNFPTPYSYVSLFLYYRGNCLTLWFTVSCRLMGQISSNTACFVFSISDFRLRFSQTIE